MRALCLALVVLAGCGDAGTGTLALSWQFVDGRRCPDTGASAVELRYGAAKQTLACSTGEPPAQVSLDEVPREGTLTARALSPQGDELYRGSLTLDAALLPAVLTLYATNAR